MTCHVINNTPFRAQALPHVDPAGRSNMLLLVKGSWLLSSMPHVAAQLAPAERQLPIYRTGLRQTLGSLALDEAQAGIVAPRRDAVWERFETDLVSPKPRFDVLVNAWAVSPDGQPRPSIDAAVDYTRAGQRHCLLALRAHAPRVWRAGAGSLGRLVPTLLAPARQVPLLRPFAFGGQALQDDGHSVSYEANPDGLGFHRSRRTAKDAALPWVGSVQTALRYWDDVAAPAALGHVPPHHLPRRGLQGTLDEQWQRQRAPHRPLDFDPRHHNAAPDALQLTETPQPGDMLTLQHMAEQPQLHFCWPGLRLAAHAETRGGTRLPLQHAQWDTVLIEPAEGLATLVWRAQFSPPPLQDIALVTLWAFAT
ncbi:DUF2169 family type VI secretion system accessory protein [Pseudorhodoferax sp.]|uniref:DUF2169 family type VI secretion system accessory protein n=1 Tax=Pseudorhodoferax sp. TaxID=1993553 RepID=UPI002DD63AE8|nr:DUF2169 domain-containing protein [Pseudorhodoferax sp.]